MILTNTGVLKLMQRVKSYIASQLNTKANSVHTHTLSEIDDLSTLSMGGGYTKSEVDTLLTGKADTSHTHTKSQITDFPSYGTTANTICEGNDSRLSDARTPTSHTHTKSEITDFPAIPTVNNATLKIQKNGTDVKTFTANASSDVTCNITVPTKVSELTNDSGFLTSHQSLSNYSTLANTIKSLSISGKTITYTKGDNTTGTLTTQDNNTWTAMVGATSSSNGSVGYVNAVPPKDGYNTKYLRADGTWQVPPDHTYNVYNKTLTIQKNGTNVATFTSNSNTDVTANISVPTKTSDLTNDSGFLTSHQSLTNYSTLANTIKSLSISGKTITYTKGDNTTGTLTTQDNNTWTAMVGATSSSNGSVGYVNAVPPKDGYNTKYLRADGTWQVPPDHTYTVNNATLTIQKNGTTVKTFTANASSNVTCNITVPTKTSDLTNDSGFISSEIDSSGTGWVRFKSGLQICYGSVSNISNVATGRTRFSFPVVFNEMPFIVTTPAMENLYITTVVSENKTNGIISAFDGTDGSLRYTSNGILVYYVAIGTWK